MRFLVAIILPVTLLLVVNCQSPTVNSDPTLCPQTSEFGNHGCARFAAILTTPAGAPASRIMLRGVLFDTASAGSPNGLDSQLSDSAGRVGLQLTWYTPPPKSDTIRLRLFAIRVPLTASESVQTIDSLDVALLFARVGQRPPFDTLRWKLRQ